MRTAALFAVALAACDVPTAVLGSDKPASDTGPAGDTAAPEPEPEPAADIAVVVEAPALGAVRAGETAATTLLILNDGDATLQLDGIAWTGEEFSIDAELPASLEPGESASVEVVYAPADEGEDVSEIVVYSDDPSTPEATVAVSGSGVVPRTVEVYLTVDNGMNVYLNGEALTASSGGSWTAVDRFEAQMWPGETLVVGAAAWNSGSYGALLAGVYVDGVPAHLSGAGGWEVAASAPGDGWERGDDGGRWLAASVCETTSQWGSYGGDMREDGAVWVGPGESCSGWSAAWFRLQHTID